MTTRGPLRRPAALAHAAFDALRADLLAGGPLTARRRIVAGELADRLGMSRTPVREALDRLARLGYLETLDGGGYQRRRYRTRDIRDVHELRLLLEPFAAELAARTSGAGLPEDGPFHVRIARASGNRVLAHVVELLAERVAAWHSDATSEPGQGPRRAVDHGSKPAHLRIAAAVARGDAEGARRTMEQHLATEARGHLRRQSDPDAADAVWAAAD